MVIRGSARLLGDPIGGVVLDEKGLLAGVVGRPERDVFGEAMAGLGAEADLLVMPESLDYIAGLLSTAVPKRAILHRLGQPFIPVETTDVEVLAVDEALLSTLPPELVKEAERALIASVRRVGGVAVSMCATSSMTETLWDVGIDTLEPYRRQGHARTCYLALASHLARLGLQPVWGAYDDNLASLDMAASLGFEPVDELWVFEFGGLR
jgi:hypothetical protein